LTNNEFHYLAEAARQRFQFMYGKAHGLSYLLDLIFIGYGLSQENRKELEDILVEVPADDTKSVDDTRRENLYMQFTDFVISAECERKSNSFRFKMLRDKRKTPLQYWQAEGVEWPLLQDIAIKLFAMATSSAASERNFSTFGFIHSKLRNSLAAEKVQNLVLSKTTIQLSQRL
jgi:hypothetical protein